MNLVGRRYVLNIAGRQFTDLRVAFEVVKTTGKEPNTLDLKVYNLNAESRNTLKQHNPGVILSAGYEESIAIIYNGTARTVDHDRKGASWETRLQGGDGETKLRFGEVNQAFPPGSGASDVLRAVVKRAGLGGGNVEKFIAAKGAKLDQFARGLVVKGKPGPVIDQIVHSVGGEWSVQDGQMQILMPDEAAPGTVPLISSGTGMVGSPEHSSPTEKNKTPFVKVRSVLRHDFKCGGQVEIKSRGVNGQFKIKQLKHSGDTHGSEWFTDLEVTAL